MKKLLMFLTVFSFLFSSSVFAHVSNEKTIYDDIEFSEAKEEIVYLRGLNIIAHERGAHLFKPEEKLTKEELAFWVAKFKNLGGHDSEKEALLHAAIENGFVDSLEGNATFGDVNNAYFDGKAPIENSGSELTKEEFAIYMGQFLTGNIEGKTLFEMVGYEKGPSGVIEKVEFEMEGEGDEAYKVFRYTINDQVYQLSKHPKILYGPVDLGVWEGKEIEESWLAPGQGDEKVVQIVKVKKDEFTEDEITQLDGSKGTHGKENQEKHEEQSEKGFPVVPVIGLIILVAILGWLFKRKR